MCVDDKSRNTSYNKGDFTMKIDPQGGKKTLLEICGSIILQ